METIENQMCHLAKLCPKIIFTNFKTNKRISMKDKHL